MTKVWHAPCHKPIRMPFILDCTLQIKAHFSHFSTLILKYSPAWCLSLAPGPPLTRRPDSFQTFIAPTLAPPSSFFYFFLKHRHATASYPEQTGHRMAVFHWGTWPPAVFLPEFRGGHRAQEPESGPRELMGREIDLTLIRCDRQKGRTAED